MPETNYEIIRDDKYGHSKLIDIPAEVAACQHKWLNETLTRVNESVVRLGVFEGKFPWHKHNAEDEFFLVLDGELVIEVEGGETSRSARTRVTPFRLASSTVRTPHAVRRSSCSSRRRQSRRETFSGGFYSATIVRSRPRCLAS